MCMGKGLRIGEVISLSIDNTFCGRCMREVFGTVAAKYDGHMLIEKVKHDVFLNVDRWKCEHCGQEVRDFISPCIDKESSAWEGVEISLLTPNKAKV